MSESSKGVEIEVKKIDGANVSHKRPTEPYQDVRASRPDRPTIVEPGIPPLGSTAVTIKKLAAILQGGPLDGTEIEISGLAQKYDAVVEVDPETIEPFKFDAEEHRRGKPNIVKGALDTITYKRTNQKTKDGLVIFSAA